MNRLEEIKEKIKQLISENQQKKQKITEIENERTRIAIIRNLKKLENKYNYNVELEQEINSLGRRITELGNESQSIQNEIDSRKIYAKQELNMQVDNQITEATRDIQKIQEAIAEIDISNVQERFELKQKMNEINNEIQQLTVYKKQIKKGNLAEIIKEKETTTKEDIENIINSILEEIQVEENIQQEYNGQVEEIPTEVFGVACIESIIAKIENGEIVYNAKINDGTSIKIYPTRKEDGNILRNAKENIYKIRVALIDYAISEYKNLEKHLIKKLDPVVCEILIKFADKYNYNASNLIYNYLLAFSRTQSTEEEIPNIVYNCTGIEETTIGEKEKREFIKICRNARKSNVAKIIGEMPKLIDMKLIWKKISNLANQIKALPEGKY